MSGGGLQLGEWDGGMSCLWPHCLYCTELGGACELLWDVWCSLCCSIMYGCGPIKGTMLCSWFELLKFVFLFVFLLLLSGLLPSSLCTVLTFHIFINIVTCYYIWNNVKYI